MMMVSTVFTILFGVAGPHRFSRTATPDSNAPCNVDSSTAEEQADYLNMSGPSATASSTLAGDYLAMTPRATLSSSPSARSLAPTLGAADAEHGRDQNGNASANKDPTVRGT